MKFKGQIGGVLPLIFLVIFVIIALALAPTIGNQTNLLTVSAGNTTGTGMNLSTATGQMLGLTPILYAVVIIVAILGSLALWRE